MIHVQWHRNAQKWYVKIDLNAVTCSKLSMKLSRDVTVYHGDLENEQNGFLFSKRQQRGVATVIIPVKF